MHTRTRRAAVALTAAAGLLASGAPAARAQASGTLAGAVYTDDDVPIFGARVTVTPAREGAARAAGPAREVLTAEGGHFGVAGLGAGWAQVVVRRLGFRPETLVVEVPQPAGGRVIVPLQRAPQVLAAVTVRATVARGPFAAFERRRAAGFGRFVTRADLERRRPNRTTDVLRNLPGVSVERNEGGAMIPRFRNATVGASSAPCYPVFWVDGTPLGPALDLDAISPAAIEGIELYSGIATVPPALRAGQGPGTCGVVAVWTRMGEPRARRVRGTPLGPDQLDSLVSAGRAFTADQVDAAALPAGGGPSPVYPDSLRTARAAGRVVAEFVVDESGEVEDATIGVVSATHPLFAQAVVAALPGARFTPAMRRGRLVRQVVHLPVAFDPELGVRAAPRDPGARGAGAADAKGPPAP